MTQPSQDSESSTAIPSSREAPLLRIELLLQSLHTIGALSPRAVEDIARAERSLGLALVETETLAFLSTHPPYVEMAGARAKLEAELVALDAIAGAREPTPRLTTEEADFAKHTQKAVEMLDAAMAAMKAGGRADAVLPKVEPAPREYKITGTLRERPRRDPPPGLRMVFDITPVFWGGRALNSPSFWLAQSEISAAIAVTIPFENPDLVPFLATVREIRFSVQRVELECIDTRRTTGDKGPDFTLDGDRAMLVRALNLLRSEKEPRAETASSHERLGASCEVSGMWGFTGPELRAVMTTRRDGRMWAIFDIGEMNLDKLFEKPREYGVYANGGLKVGYLDGFRQADRFLAARVADRRGGDPFLVGAIEAHIVRLGLFLDGDSVGVGSVIPTTRNERWSDGKHDRSEIDSIVFADGAAIRVTPDLHPIEDVELPAAPVDAGAKPPPNTSITDHLAAATDEVLKALQSSRDAAHANGKPRTQEEADFLTNGYDALAAIAATMKAARHMKKMAEEALFVAEVVEVANLPPSTKFNPARAAFYPLRMQEALGREPHDYIAVAKEKVLQVFDRGAASPTAGPRNRDEDERVLYEAISVIAKVAASARAAEKAVGDELFERMAAEGKAAGAHAALAGLCPRCSRIFEKGDALAFDDNKAYVHATCGKPAATPIELAPNEKPIEEPGPSIGARLRHLITAIEEGRDEARAGVEAGYIESVPSFANFILSGIEETFAEFLRPKPKAPPAPTAPPAPPLEIRVIAIQKRGDRCVVIFDPPRGFDAQALLASTTQERFDILVSEADGPCRYGAAREFTLNRGVLEAVINEGDALGPAAILLERRLIKLWLTVVDGQIRSVEGAWLQRSE